MEDCIFCKIVKGDIPCAKVYEDESFLGFLDIEPVKKGHTLLIPKEHVVWFEEMEDGKLSESFIVSKKIIKSMKENLGSDYVQIGVVGTDVPHFHIHLIPRKISDGKLSVMRPQENYENEEEKKEIVEKIKSAQ